MNYDGLTDNELILKIHNGNQDATEILLKRYTPLVKKSTRTLYIIGADTEDLTQEGMIGLFKAIQTYQTKQNASFFTYAKLCIDRQIYSAIKASNRKKHIPLNSYISLYTSANEDDFNLINSLAADNDTNPEHIILLQEKQSHMQEKIKQVLSKMEQEVLTLYLSGKSYMDIATQLDKSSKSIDNTIQRIRKKIKTLLPDSI